MVWRQFWDYMIFPASFDCIIRSSNCTRYIVYTPPYVSRYQGFKSTSLNPSTFSSGNILSKASPLQVAENSIDFTLTARWSEIIDDPGSPSVTISKSFIRVREAYQTPLSLPSHLFNNRTSLYELIPSCPFQWLAETILQLLKTQMVRIRQPFSKRGD